MVKFMTLLLGLWLSSPNAAFVKEDALAAQQQASTGLKQFNPASILKGYTATPPESQIPTEENQDALKAMGLSRASQDETAVFVRAQEASRQRIKPNPKSIEMEYAEKLIGGAGAVTGSACYKQAVPCQDSIVQKTCDETALYQAVNCANDTLTVNHQTILHPTKVRLAFLSTILPIDGIDLRACRATEVVKWGGMVTWQCTAKELIQISPRCKSLDVAVTYADGTSIEVIGKPTCESPVLIIQSKKVSMGQGFFINIAVTEKVHFDDTWSTHDCAKTIEQQGGFCVLEQANVCMQPNATKIINGEPVTRPCWGHESAYRCTQSLTSTCAPLMAAGCSHVSSNCTSKTGNHCDHVVQTFQCPERTCFPDKTVCPGEVSCADGSCDDTVPEASNDINEGLSRLGSLAGTAEDVAKNQIDVGQARIFAGSSQECEKFPLKSNDCCVGKGWGDWIIHCPKELQVLKKAKHENRVVSLGKYKDGVTSKYVFCVFPTKLAAIIQMQGRRDQLQIPFGIPKAPDCRGITPEELERINFDNLKLDELVAEWTGRKNIPDSSAMETSLTNHVEQLEAKGVAHE